MTRMIEILALGSGLRAEAARECECLNESYFLVHQVLARAFVDDPDVTASEALHEQLSGRVQSTLIARARRIRSELRDETPKLRSG